MSKFHCRIFFKGGGNIGFECAKLTITRNTATGSISRLSWVDAKPDLLYVDLDSVALITSEEIHRGFAR